MAAGNNKQVVTRVQLDLTFHQRCIQACSLTPALTVRLLQVLNVSGAVCTAHFIRFLLWTGNILCVFQVKTPFKKFIQRYVSWAWSDSLS